ncbi:MULTISPECIES: helix-turn-helix domain-containing protein [Clostridium]|uniref:helix-turn-helix domain-containing protein n=1 Tax=Clostridium TaxID=1485 RepID=UPI00069F99F3|nr:MULTISPECIES: helix-turn-helix domain-containing protein [Clostridium]KOF56644.1 hypothetical protein AGR56_07905 [Clostridium sp. DMHC 10]MCD2348108.1 helix-turn-helix domain-containing protein [Clostridium guangxiense]
MEQLLTKKDVAKLLNVSLPTIDRYISDKILTPVKGIPTVRFTPSHIEELEGVEPERFSPLERRRLEKELEEWKHRAEEAEKIIARVNMITTETMYLKLKESV